MKKIALLAFFLCLIVGINSSWAQYVTSIGPITPGDFAIYNSPTIIKDGGYGPSTLPLPQNEIYVGSAANVAAAVAMGGDCTIVSAGTITCTKLNGVSPGALFPLNIGTGLNASGGNLNLDTALPNGTTATTQSSSDNSTKIATDAFVASQFPLSLANGGLGGSQSAATANQIPVFPGGSGAAVPTGFSAWLDSAVGTTQGAIIYRGASSWTALAPGTSGQFLETQGVSANPQWASAPGGGCGLGIACMWASSGQSESPTSPWNVADIYGNNLSSICSGTTSQCLQEFINYIFTNGEQGKIYCGATVTVSKQTGTVTNGSPIVTGLSSTSSLHVNYFVVGNGANNNYIPSFTGIASIDSSTQIHLSNNATGSGTITLWFSVDQNLNTIQSTSTIIFPPIENGFFEADGCTLNGNESAGPVVSFDSFMALTFLWYGIIEAQQNTAYPIILFQPKNPVPLDGIVTDTASTVFISNPVAGGSATTALIDFDLTYGGINDGTFGFVELNGGVNNLVVANAQSNTGFSGNHVTVPNAHGASGSSILEGGSTNQSSYAQNIWKLSVQATSGNICFDSFGKYENVSITCTGGNTGIYAEAGATISGTITTNVATPINSGGNFSGIANQTIYSGGTALTVP